MTSFRSRTAASDERIRAHLDPDELLLAVGLAEDVSDGGGPEHGGAARTWIVITARRLRWTPRLDPTREAALDLDDVTAVRERMRAHRYAIDLTHDAIARLAPPLRTRFRPRRWARTEPLERSFTQTSLAFSRRETKAARALRGELIARGVLAADSEPEILPVSRDPRRGRSTLVRIV